MDPSQLTLGVAFLAGLASFLSPCVLPLVPIYLAQLVGQSVYQSSGDLEEERPMRLTTFLHAVMFVSGFTLAFVALGATASTLGEFLRIHEFYPASFVIGLVFAIGWTPCVGLILGPVLVLASNAATLREGVLLLLVYSLGLGVPFLLLGLGLDRFSTLLKWLKPHTGKIEIGTGVIMILMGIMIYFNWLIYLNRYFNFGISV